MTSGHVEPRAPKKVDPRTAAEPAAARAKAAKVPKQKVAKVQEQKPAAPLPATVDAAPVVTPKGQRKKGWVTWIPRSTWEGLVDRQQGMVLKVFLVCVLATIAAVAAIILLR